MGKPQDDKDPAKNFAGDLADIAGQLASLKGEANSWLCDSNFNSLKPRLVSGLTAVEAATIEARRRVRLNEER